MGSIETFVSRMRYWCDEANLGYNQSKRWNFKVVGSCDCSSLVIHCLNEAGFDTGSASYTGDMSSNLTSRGWKRLDPNGSPCVGDILLNDNHHVAVCTGSNCMSYASIDENGNISGGQDGDQTGLETKTVTGFYYSRGWDCYLRYCSESKGRFDVANIPTVKQGTNNRTAGALQEILKAKGFYHGELDCSFGPVSTTALKNYQAENGLEDDGICGPVTWSKILIG